jgi:hypothetical protein
MRYESKQYPSSGDRRPKKVKVDSMTPSNKGFAKATEVKAGYVYEEGEQKKIRGTGAATKGTSFTCYIK